ncbi:MAG TPA: hypothetical protein VEI55_05835 [Candidatus Acidoferrum sp.]|nr:hypothetical protein [Candidatus Acidoferrum sp.]
MTEPTAVVSAERTVLRALTTRFVEPPEWVEIDRKLAGYSWREPDHAVIYQAITAARSRDPRGWREQLAAQTTRMGFPDLDWEAFLRPSPMGTTESSLDQLIQALERAVDRTG